MRKVVNLQDLKSVLQNDTYRILSYYDQDRDLRLNFEDVINFFKDSNCRYPRIEALLLFKGDTKREVTYDEVFKYLFDQLLEYIISIDKDLLTFLKTHEYHKDNEGKKYVYFTEIEDFLKEKSIVNPRLAALYLVLRINGNDESFEVSKKDIKNYLKTNIEEYKKQINLDLEKEIKKERKNQINYYDEDGSIIGYPTQ